MHERMPSENYGGSYKRPGDYFKPETADYPPPARQERFGGEREKDERSAREIINGISGLEDALLTVRLRDYNNAGEKAVADLNNLLARLTLEKKIREGKVVDREPIRSRKDARETPQPGETPEDRIERLVVRNETVIVYLGKEKTPVIFKPRDGEPVVIDQHGREHGVYDRQPRRQYLRAWLAGFITKAADSDVVPVTGIREIEGRLGSVQEFAVGHDAGNVDWRKANESDLQLIAALDYVWQIADRHSANFRIDTENQHVRAIDNDLILPTMEETPLLSYPLRFMSGKEILPEVRQKLQKFLEPDRISVLEKSFKFVFKEEGGAVWQRFQDRLSELMTPKAGAYKFPDYTLPDEESEDSFLQRQKEWSDLQPTRVIY